MMGVKQREDKLFYNFSLSSRIPKDHFLRKLDEAIDFSFIYKLARPYYSYTGQPGIDPAVLLKMMLIGYLYNIASERKLAQELKVNLAFMYFLGYEIDEETPNHSVLSKARRRFGNRIFEKFFEMVVEKCKEQGLIEAEKSFIDSTLIPANASLNSVVDCDEKIILRRSPKDYLKAMDELNPVESENDKEPKKERSKAQTNQTAYSKTDPEASIIRHHNTRPKLAYKQHINVDSGSARVITACTTTPAAVADEHKLPHLISKANEQHDILPKEVGADTKYGTVDNYRFLLENQLKPSVPHHRGGSNTGLLAKDNFVYDKKKDQYICPEGKALKKAGFIKHQRHFIYRTNPKDCKNCKLLKKCTRSPAGRSVTRHIDENFLERAQEHLKTSQAKATINQRGGYVETVFACEKKDLGLNKAKFRGLMSVHIQSVLTASAYNLKKLIKYSRGFKEKLKATRDLPILPMLEANKVGLEEKLVDSRVGLAASNLKEAIFLVFKQIFGFRLAYNVT